MDTTRIPRIALVTVLCLLMVTSLGVVVAEPISSDPSEENFVYWEGFEDGTRGDWTGGEGVAQESFEDTYSLQTADPSTGGVDDAEYSNPDLGGGDTKTIYLREYTQDWDAQGFSQAEFIFDIQAPNSDMIRLVHAKNDGEFGGNGFALRVGDTSYDNIGSYVGQYNDIWIEYTDSNIKVWVWESGTERPSQPQYDIDRSIHSGYHDPDRFRSPASSRTNAYIDQVGLESIPDSGVSGGVTDSNNEPLPDVTVEAEQSGTVVESDTTNSVGQYDITVENGTYNVTASKQDYQSQTETVTVDGSVEQNFQLAQFNQSINLDTKRFIEHGQRADYRVVVTNDTGRHNVTGEATVTSGNESVVTVDTDALELQATTDISVNNRTAVTAEWNDSDGNVYSTQTNVTVANATVENIDILPTWTKTSASLGDETLQLIIVATMIGAGAALVASSFAGLSAATGITVLGWFAGMASDGILIVSFMMAIFIGLNLAGNVDLQVRQ